MARSGLLVELKWCSRFRCRSFDFWLMSTWDSGGCFPVNEGRICFITLAHVNMHEGSVGTVRGITHRFGLAVFGPYK